RANGLEHEACRVLEGRGHGAASSILVSAAAESRCDRLDVNIALAAQADLHRPVDLAEKTRDTHGAERPRIVHELLGFDEALRHDALWQRQPCDPTIVAHPNQ